MWQKTILSFQALWPGFSQDEAASNDDATVSRELLERKQTKSNKNNKTQKSNKNNKTIKSNKKTKHKNPIKTIEIKTTHIKKNHLMSSQQMEPKSEKWNQTHQCCSIYHTGNTLSQERKIQNGIIWNIWVY